MNYYEDALQKIRKAREEGSIDEAVKLIEDELKAPYLPGEFEEEIRKIYEEIRPASTSYVIADDEICEYLKGPKEKQLLAVDHLDKKNLRDYTDICSEYLCSEGFLNAKVLLIDSLIRQEIGEEIRMEERGIVYEFIPKYLLRVEESDGYIRGSRYIADHYLKEPSRNRIALDLLYKELMLRLPINLDEEEGVVIAKDIIEYVDKAFTAQASVPESTEA